MNKNKLIAVSMLAAAMLAACGGDGGGGSVAKLMKGGETPQAEMQAAAPTPPATAPATVQQAQQVITQMVTAVVQVEVTRVVEQPIVVVVTATPDIQGFIAPVGIDESTQPCPVKFWKRGRCTATQAQMDAAAQGGN